MTIGGNLHRLSADNAHTLCAHQVVVSLCMAVKELVDNALDAGANQIDVNLFHYGLTKISVSDNGPGIDPDQYAALGTRKKIHAYQTFLLLIFGVAQRHATSKIREFQDLETIQTLGFRGEALNALCALSATPLEICTRQSTETVGTLLRYDKQGKLISQTPQARQPGTTVTIQNIFAHLPVRFAELDRHKVREYTKVVDLLQQYAIIMSDVRFMCSHTTMKGTTTTPIRTSGSAMMREAILSLYGSKFVQTLEKIEFNAEYDDRVKVSGWISQPKAGHGRSSADRQILAINRRPCDFSKFNRAINEIYRSFLPNQTAAYFLLLELREGTFDVNVTPDKRTIFVHDEQELISAFQEYLTKLWEPTRGQMTLSVAPVAIETPRMVSNSVISHSIAPSRDDSNITETAKRIDTSVIDNKPPQVSLEDVDHSQKRQKVDDVDTGSASTTILPRDTIGPDVILYKPLRQPSASHDSNNSSVIPKLSMISEKTAMKRNEPAAQESTNATRTAPIETDGRDSIDVAPKITTFEIAKDHHVKNTEELVQAKRHTYGYQSEFPVSFENIRSRWLDRSRTCGFNFKTYPNAASKPLVVSRNTITATLEGVEQDETTAIKQLTTCLTQMSFPRLQIIGQFNLGFILTILRDQNHYDIFIVDQHAADEKFRFEGLERDTVVSIQPLVCRKRLEMAPHQLQSAQSNQEFLKKNGFQVQFESDPGSGCSCAYLTAVPNVKGKSFTDQNLDELLFLLHDSPNPERVRCSKMRAIFASKACRTAWMIGTALEYRHMRDIVNNLTALRQPWNCPHGRPTMRWLYRGHDSLSF